MLSNFICILWPPAKPHFDAMQNEIDEKYKVVYSKDYFLNDKNFKKFMFGVYKPDKTPSSRLKKKHKAMRKHGSDIRIIQIEINNPTMLPHKKARLRGKLYCQEAKRLKRKIREMFVSKVKGYIYDIIFHTSDNKEHNKHINKLIKKYATK